MVLNREPLKKTIQLCAYVMCLVKNQVLRDTAGHCMHRKDLDPSLINLNVSQIEEFPRNSSAVVWVIIYSMLGSVPFVSGIL